MDVVVVDVVAAIFILPKLFACCLCQSEGGLHCWYANYANIYFDVVLLHCNSK